MPVEDLLGGEAPEEYLRALVALHLAAAVAVAARIRPLDHVDRESVRRAVRVLLVGMHVHR